MAFSLRSRFSLQANPWHQATERRRLAGAPIVDLTLSNPTQAGLAWLRAEELLAALSMPANLSYTAEPFGMRPAREALARWLGGRGLEVPPERLCLTASTSEAYGFLFKLLCDPGDAVLVPSPSYPLLEYLATLESVRLVPYQLSFDGEWYADRLVLTRALADAGGRTRAVVTVHPNNPTGHYLRRAELDLLATVCAEHDLALISDEVFYDHPLERPADLAPRAAARADCLTFSLGGLSKLGLPQLKLGWIAANGPSREVADALARLDLIADTWLSVGTPAQVALPAILSGVDAFLAATSARLRENLSALDAALRSTLTASRLRCEAGWTALLRLPQVGQLTTSEAWALRLLDAGVLVQPGYFYGLTPDAYIAVSLLCEPESFSSGVRALAEAASDASHR